MVLESRCRLSLCARRRARQQECVRRRARQQECVRRRFAITFHITHYMRGSRSVCEGGLTLHFTLHITFLLVLFFFSAKKTAWLTESCNWTAYRSTDAHLRVSLVGLALDTRRRLIALARLTLHLHQISPTLVPISPRARLASNRSDSSPPPFR
jgi:hypothetical protein